MKYKDIIADMEELEVEVRRTNMLLKSKMEINTSEDLHLWLRVRLENLESYMLALIHDLEQTR